MNTQIIHQTREGLNNQEIILCGAKAEFIPHTSECGFPRAACTCKITVECADCQREKKARAVARAERARQVLAAKEEKLRGMDNVQIYDED